MRDLRLTPDQLDRLEDVARGEVRLEGGQIRWHPTADPGRVRVVTGPVRALEARGLVAPGEANEKCVPYQVTTAGEQAMAGTR